MAIIVIVLCVAAVASLGWLRPLDHALRDLRFALDKRAPTGEVVFLEIDSRALDAVGVWPWPRRVHAEVTTRLMELGAAEVAFDVDFSTASTPEDDRLFAEALEEAGGYAMLAAFRQAAHGSAGSTFNMPIAAFLAHALPVTVNVPVEPNGNIREYPYALTLGAVAYPSLAAALAQVHGPADVLFPIDFSIDAAQIARYSVAELLEGRLGPEHIENRQVVVGASALELRDTFVVPVQGVLPGGMVQILASETLRLGRVLPRLGLWPVLGSVLALGAIALMLRERLRLPNTIAAGLAVAAGTEALAFVMQVQGWGLFNSAAIHLTLLGLVLERVQREVKGSRMLQAQAARERDATRIILDSVIADNFDGVVVVGEDGTIFAASRLAEDLLGAGLRGRNAKDVLPRALRQAVEDTLEADGRETSRHPEELLLPQPEGDARRIEYVTTLSKVEDGARGVRARRVACLTFRDITERRRDEERLQFLAGHDPLTGALSRVKLVEVIDELTADDEARARGAVVVMLDLGRFKTVNDTLGHSYGDMVLKQVVSRIRACGVDAVARLGGDSFALLLQGWHAGAELDAFLQELLSRIAAPYQLKDGHQAIIAASAGATTSQLSGYEPEVLLSHADMALSAAKQRLGSHCVMFASEMDERLKQKQDMELALGEAIARNQLSLAFQPQVSLETGETVGVEALLRWQHPVLGAVSPARFIPAAEETGQILELGRWALRTACREVAGWPGRLRLAVNVSPIQFELVDMVEEVRDALESSGLPADQLDVEITESVLIARASSVTETLQRLRALGVGISLDDFGTGYSSLSYLGRLPIDKIKIDQSFVRNLPADAESGAIIRAVMTLSETLDKIVVAEGIQNADQAWMLHMMGCHIGQGYHFSRPRSAEEMRDWISSHHAVKRPVAV